MPMFMNKPAIVVESVPNFSEGRRKDVVDALAAALTSAGARLLDVEMDAAHNRSVLSIAGDPDAVARGVIEAVGAAAERIDLREHRGEHPRIGATDVVPFIPIAGLTIEECVALSVRVAEAIAERWGIPVYLYEQSARVPARQDLAYIRKGEFEGLRGEVRTNPERKPDYGPSELHPSAGATVVGARFPLIAYNVYLDTPKVQVAQAVARAVRHSSGGLRYVKALGFEIEQRNQAQVSMNLTNFDGTPIFRAFDMVAREAARHGARAVSSEIVGLVPQRALDACAEHYLQLESFTPRQVLENRLEEAGALGGGSAASEELIDRIASATPAPGGGSAAALAGALAAALGEMVSRLTAGNKKFGDVEPRMRELAEQLRASRVLMRSLADEDARAYDAVVAARRLPKATAEETRARDTAIAAATRRATEVPLRTARAAAETISCLEELATRGNPNLISDAATGCQIAFAALKGAEYNVRINIAGSSDAFADACRRELAALVETAAESLRRIDALTS